MSELSLIYTYRGKRRGVRKPDPNNTVGRWATIPDGDEIADIEIYVDVKKLVAAVGEKAMKSKARKTKIQGGAIILKAVNIKRVPA